MTRDRFLLRGAIRHASKGGVFRATDQTTARRSRSSRAAGTSRCVPTTATYATSCAPTALREPALRPAPGPRDDTDRLLGDGLTYLIDSTGQGVDPDGTPEPGTERRAPADPFGAITDP